MNRKIEKTEHIKNQIEPEAEKAKGRQGRGRSGRKRSRVGSGGETPNGNQRQKAEEKPGDKDSEPRRGELPEMADLEREYNERGERNG